jgi:hypothetical protein
MIDMISGVLVLTLAIAVLAIAKDCNDTIAILDLAIMTTFVGGVFAIVCMVL